MCILHQYHKVSGLKLEQRCVRSEKNEVNIFHQFKLAMPMFFSWEGGVLAVMKEYEIITLKYIRKACRVGLIYFGASEDIIL